MTKTAAPDTDLRTGVAMVFGVLGLIGALVMLTMGLTHQQVLAGWGFAGAVFSGAVLIVVLHVYGSSEIINP